MKPDSAAHKARPAVFLTVLLTFFLTAARVFAVGGDLDTTFQTGVANFSSTVQAIAAQPDGRVVIGGTFTVAGGRAFNLPARLDADGTTDQSFNIGTGFNVSVNRDRIKEQQENEKK